MATPELVSITSLVRAEARDLARAAERLDHLSRLLAATGDPVKAGRVRADLAATRKRLDAAIARVVEQAAAARAAAERMGPATFTARPRAR